jgi:DNA-binding transcriptional MerR regulator
VRISELAEELGVPTSTLRYYERIGLAPSPPRTASGYRDYDDETAARLRFVTRAKRIGLSLEQIAEVLPVWDGIHCTPTHEQISGLVEDKRAEILARIDELHRLVEQLDEVRKLLETEPPPTACVPDLSCCVPTPPTRFTALTGMPTRLPSTPKKTST